MKVLERLDDKSVDLVHSIDSVLALMTNLAPPHASPGQIWPPPIGCHGWNGRNAPHSIPYSKGEVREILKVVVGHRLNQGEVLLTNFDNGLPAVLWGAIFERVIAINQNPLNSESILEPDQTILFGTLGDSRFLYRVIEHILNLRAIVIDETYYAHVMSTYFLFRRLITRPGIVIFMKTKPLSEHAGVRQFLSDLSSGSLDNRKHRIAHILTDPDGYGISYEQIP